MTTSLVSFVWSNSGKVNLRNDDDTADRLNHRFTFTLLVLFAVIVTTVQYGDRIQCWAPAHFSGNHEKYANEYCWVRNTYYLPFEEYIPKDEVSADNHFIPYYQWMPLILVVMGLLFNLPIAVWRNLNARSGIDVNNVIEAAESFITKKQDDATKEKTMTYMTKQMNRYLTSQRQHRPGCTVSIKHLLSRTCCRLCGRHRGNYLIMVYLGCKLLFILNVIGQLFLLNVFLGTDFHMYGIDVIRAVIAGEDWTATSRFPRVTMCDFKVRRLGNIQRYTLQCVLPINLFNEKIFLFLWFWLAFVAFITCFSALQWTLRCAFRVDRHRYVRKHLRIMNKMDRDTDKKKAVKFVEDYLGQDGVFVLRLIGHNTNGLTVSEFTAALWDEYRSKPVIEASAPPSNA